MTTHQASQTGLVARCPEDLIAFVPVAIGFVPETSVVMLTFGASSRTFHARVDLPDDPGDVDELVESLLAPARHHRIGQVVFVLYDDDTPVADEAAWSLLEAFTDAGLTVIDVLRVHDGRWFAMAPGRPPAAYLGVRFDRGTHPFAAQAVFDGRVTHPSRAALQASLDGDPRSMAETEAALSGAGQLDARSVRRLVERHTAARTRCTPGELAALGAALVEAECRDAAWSDLDRGRASAHVDFWSDAVRRLPRVLVPGAASVLALAAWLSGDGALAWCAVDRCREVVPDHSLARLVADLLEHATNPQVWDALRPGLAVAPDGAG